MEKSSTNPSTANIIQHNSFVTIHYTISILDENNQINQTIANTFDGTPATITIGYGNIPSTLEEVLIGKTEDEEINTNIKNAFGEYNQELLQVISKNLLEQQSAEQNFTQGDIVSFTSNKGQMAGTFIQQNENGSALFDFNHPLAGKTIAFKAKVIGVL
ncbi:MAG: hypothetical protein RLZZ210_1365 [Pseudomonadota bacterium]|jgi:FKBP-type peptidyl-prolyl cis-trans isomerase SlpA